MTKDEQFKLITRNLEEVLTSDELKELINSNTPLKHYIGFEISGKLHLGYLFTLLKVKDLQDAGAETVIWLADLHSAINDKLGGNLENIKKVARGYFTDAIKALFECVGGKSEKLIFKLCSETYAQNPDFWLTFLEVGRNTTLARTKRSITIMGREESDEIDTAKLMYPIMQAADIFLLGVNIAHAGIDQRKVHVIARDVATNLGRPKPVAIHHPILLGLTPPGITYHIDDLGRVVVTTNFLREQVVISTPKGPVSIGAGATGIFENIENAMDISELAMRNKMSKSKTESGISIHDNPEEIKRKVNQAYAPEGIVENNPILNWTRYLIFYDLDSKLHIKRAEKWGGDLDYSSYEDLEKDYLEKLLHPQDLKVAVAEWLIKKLEPARKYFEDPKRKTALKELEQLTNN